MADNKRTIQRYIDGFIRSDHAQILSCLTDDVEWLIPGFCHHFGKEAFDKEIENPAFTGSPSIQMGRMIEEDDVVALEGTVQCQRKDGAKLHLAFCDVFVFRDGKIRKVTSYLNEMKP